MRKFVSRATYQQVVALFCIPVLLISMSACGGTSALTASEIFSAAATSVGSVLKAVVPNWTGLPAYNALVAQATPLIAAGLTGTNGQKVLQVVGDIVSLLSTVPGIPPEYQAIIAIGLAGFQSVIALIQAAQPATTGVIRATPPAKYKSVNAYKKAWNAEIAKHPELAGSKL